MSAKIVTALALLSFLIMGCGHSAQQSAADRAAKVDSATSQSSTADISLPGMKAADSMPAGCYLRAVIDGKKWDATEMTPDQSHLSLVTINGKNGNRTITFVIGRNRENIGKPSNLSESNQITYWGGDAFIVGAQSGQYTVTKMDDQFIEGTFNFIGEKDGKTVTCTDGEFRTPAPQTPSSN